ncbi:uncharacterized protein LOC110697739 [Chenopodium quinoa]|uniref:uncharacterized protein LOC110697739 n=1 Tax=Chenopodium quinoa TaxID=63459 RepID=UPI000B77E1B8|nr:uncharacterized protein LOC110697739 [Chenopodium quinoa]XP_021730810.1 uncharacterized protein LOC110697739 [Chenopodium quinoa]XP_021730811.1 uncharacterized protein LOC110697739 [Chenopodium quinoa]XP_021730812.1 uncharacterized protein LOC110697739 [Chenopodium quinoa]XP_021730813.1 uncharacterized protein LOC110697739 [Chenopodium quinoa]
MSKKRKQASANEASETGEAEESAECENRKGRTVAAVVGKAILSGVKIPLEWNHNKVPVGENRDIFSSYIGVVVREKVNINHRDWEEVPKEVIDDLFKFITRGFIVPEERRNYVLGRASIRWRAFKARLRKDWMYDTKGVNPNVIIKNPPSIYPFITQADWTKFIETYTDDAFKAAELQKQGVQVRDVPRHLVWIRAHSRQKDGAMTFDNPADFEIAQTIKALEAQQIQGEIEATGRNDILARALKNPEHGGCVRGVGSGFTNKLYFGYYKPLPQSQLQSDLKCLKSKLENVVNTQNLLLSYLMSSGQVNTEQLKELSDSNGNQVAHQLAGIQAGGSGGQGLDGLGLARDSWLQGLSF